MSAAIDPAEVQNAVSGYEAGVTAWHVGRERTTNPYYANTRQWIAFNSGWDDEDAWMKRTP
jgi:hypothetical protein